LSARDGIRNGLEMVILFWVSLFVFYSAICVAFGWFNASGKVDFVTGMIALHAAFGIVFSIFGPGGFVWQHGLLTGTW
jgi:hypothetical protein